MGKGGKMLRRCRCGGALCPLCSVHSMLPHEPVLGAGLGGPAASFPFMQGNAPWNILGADFQLPGDPMTIVAALVHVPPGVFAAPGSGAELQGAIVPVYFDGTDGMQPEGTPSEPLEGACYEWAARLGAALRLPEVVPLWFTFRNRVEWVFIHIFACVATLALQAVLYVYRVTPVPTAPRVLFGAQLIGWLLFGVAPLLAALALELSGRPHSPARPARMRSLISAAGLVLCPFAVRHWLLGSAELTGVQWASRGELSAFTVCFASFWLCSALWARSPAGLPLRPAIGDVISLREVRAGGMPSPLCSAVGKVLVLLHCAVLSAQSAEAEQPAEAQGAALPLLRPVSARFMQFIAGALLVPYLVAICVTVAVSAVMLPRVVPAVLSCQPRSMACAAGCARLYRLCSAVLLSPAVAQIVICTAESLTVGMGSPTAVVNGLAHAVGPYAPAAWPADLR